MNINLNNIPNHKGIDIRFRITSFVKAQSDESYQCHILNDKTIPIIRYIMGRNKDFEIDIEFALGNGRIEYIEISNICGEFCVCHGKYEKDSSQFCRYYETKRELPSYIARLFN